MGSKFRTNLREPADDMGGGASQDIPPQQPPPPRTAAPAAPPAGPAVQRPPPSPQWSGGKDKGKNAFQVAGEWMFGNGQKPGVFGTGQYEVQAPTVNTGAGTLPNAGQTRQRVGQGIQDTQTRQVGVDFRNAQTGLMGDLQAASRGEGPSAAQEMLRRGTDANAAAAVAAANSVRGPGGGAQLGQLMASQALAGQQAVSDASVMRAQEQLQARQQLADVAQSGRSADMQDQAQRDQLMQYYVSLGFDVDKAEQAANMEMERLRVATGLEVEGMRSSAYGDAAARNGKLFDKVVNGVAAAAGVPIGG